MDYLSDGRYEFGLGAGWIKNEYEAANLSFDEFPERFARFAETVEAYKAFMSGEQMQIDGQSLKWPGFHGIPSPAQQSHPPIMIGGGSKKILTYAGQQVDIVSLNFNNRAGVIGTDGMNSGLAEATAASMGEALGMSADDILKHPHCLIGTVDFICDELQHRREQYGISYAAVLDDGTNNMADEFAPVVSKLAGK